jgi:L-asparaginase
MVASANLNYRDVSWLIGEITKLAAEGSADGVVIVQGTDTLEEMAFILDSLLDVSLPVVVTGAMRSPNMAGAEGSANILASVIAASSKDLKSSGVTVVMNDDIHGARAVKKSHTGNVAAFKSVNGGTIGRIVEGQVRIFNQLKSRQRIKIRGDINFPKIAVIKACFGDDDQMIKLVAGADYEGLVIEAFGAGHLPESWLEELTALSLKIPIILSSRTGEGHVFQKSYGYKGAEIDLIARGLIPSGVLDGPKSKILLGLILAHKKTATSEEIAAFFENI